MPYLGKSSWGQKFVFPFKWRPKKYSSHVWNEKSDFW